MSAAALVARLAAPVVGEAAFIWQARVTLGGVDVTDRLTGRISVEAEENAARVAHFGMVAAGVEVELSSMARQAVTISFERYDAAGVRTGLWRLFTGLVDGPEYDSASRVLTLTCSDARQAKIAAMTRAQIDALVPGGLWSPHIFDRESTAEQYLADRLGTTAGAVDGDAYGALAFTPWSGSSTRTVTEAEILDESLVPALAGAGCADDTSGGRPGGRRRAPVVGLRDAGGAPAHLRRQYHRGSQCLAVRRPGWHGVADRV